MATHQLSHDRPTPESIARAKAARDAERERVFQATGVRVSDDGVPRIVVVHCHKPGCLFVAARGTEELAIRAVSTHYSLKHGLSLVQSRS